MPAIPSDDVPDWESIELPDPEVLTHLTDAHCHPTDLSFSREDVQDVGLGALSAMATRKTDQDLVRDFALQHGRRDGDDMQETSAERRRDPEAVACFGYHPWFSHLLHLQPEDNSPTKADHYASLFLPASTSASHAEQRELLDKILPDLPEPIAVRPLIGKMRDHAVRIQRQGGLVMIGEVGLDKSFRVPNPTKPKGGPDSTKAKGGQDSISKSLTPFRPNINHQAALLEMQMDLAVELGINVSLHSVKAQGPTLDFLRQFKKKHGDMFVDRVNVDIHSCGGWSIESWLEAEKQFPNLYLSPSLAVSGRSPLTPSLIRAADPSRLLVESDTHRIQDTTRRTWAAAVWIANCRGWKIERSQQDLKVDEESDLGVVRRLESNWNRFMNIDTLAP